MKIDEYDFMKGVLVFLEFCWSLDVNMMLKFILIRRWREKTAMNDFFHTMSNYNMMLKTNK